MIAVCPAMTYTLRIVNCKVLAILTEAYKPAPELVSVASCLESGEMKAGEVIEIDSTVRSGIEANARTRVAG